MIYHTRNYIGFNCVGMYKNPVHYSLDAASISFNGQLLL